MCVDVGFLMEEAMRKSRINKEVCVDFRFLMEEAAREIGINAEAMCELFCNFLW